MLLITNCSTGSLPWRGDRELKLFLKREGEKIVTKKKSIKLQAEMAVLENTLSPKVCSSVPPVHSWYSWHFFKGQD